MPRSSLDDGADIGGMFDLLADLQPIHHAMLAGDPRYPPPQQKGQARADYLRMVEDCRRPHAERWIPETLLAANFDRSKGDAAVIREVLHNARRLRELGRVVFTICEDWAISAARYQRAEMLRARSWPRR